MGKVFSIDEFSIFDGPGLRASVFLKGCPLSCVWCHSPEGQSPAPQLIRAEGCVGCGNCQAEGLSLKEQVLRCPNGLLRICGEEIDSARLSKRLLALGDLVDGVTFSGGEALMQGTFLLECLDALAGKLHRAVQTCGFASTELFQKMLTKCDFVLMDLKLMDSQLHLQYTGVDNELILANYRMLAQSGVPFITRVPLIPMVTDTEENITAIASFMYENGVTKVELMPYNTMAGAKYKSVGRIWAPPFDETVPCNPHKEIWKSYGIEVKVL